MNRSEPAELPPTITAMQLRKLLSRSADRAQLLKLPPTISVERAGELLGMSRSAAYRAVAAGDLKAFRMNGRWYVPTAPLLKLLLGAVA
jgi:hypothetical protein